MFHYQCWPSQLRATQNWLQPPLARNNQCSEVRLEINNWASFCEQYCQVCLNSMQAKRWLNIWELGWILGAFCIWMESGSEKWGHAFHMGPCLATVAKSCKKRLNSEIKSNHMYLVTHNLGSWLMKQGFTVVQCSIHIHINILLNLSSWSNLATLNEGLIVFQSACIGNNQWPTWAAVGRLALGVFFLCCLAAAVVWLWFRDRSAGAG